MSLVIVEGPDGAGKTTLIRNLEPSFGRAVVRRHGAYLGESDISRHYMRDLLEAIDNRGDVVFMDRSWLSEPVYGRAARGGLTRMTDREEQMLVSAAWVARAVVVLCLPPYEACLSAWASRPAEEYLKKSAQLRAVYDGYAASVVRWRATLPTVIVYDRTRDDEAWLMKNIGGMLP